MTTSIDVSQETLAIDVWTALKFSQEHRRKHILQLLRLYGDQAIDTCPNVGAMVYFADEKVHFYQLHNESELRLPQDCFLTSCSTI